MSNNIEVLNIGYGMNLYRNAISKIQCDSIIKRLENSANDPDCNLSWSTAMVNDIENIDYVRNCIDIKYKRDMLGKSGISLIRTCLTYIKK